MTWPRARIRITLTEHNLDEDGLLNDLALRWIRGLLEDAPARATVIIDLGPLRLADRLLIAALSEAPCAANIAVEASNWRLAQTVALGLAQNPPAMEVG